MSDLGSSSEDDPVVPYPMDPEPISAVETEEQGGGEESDDAEMQFADVGPAIPDEEPVDLEPYSADVDPVPDEQEQPGLDIVEPAQIAAQRQPAGLSPGSFSVSQAPTQRSPLEGMSGMLGTDMQTPDFRTQIRETLEPAFREMAFSFQRELQESIADATNAMEQRHLI